MAEFTIQAFEESGKENGQRFWYADDFMGRLGYGSWASFRGVITKAMGSCIHLGLDPTEEFVKVRRVDGDQDVDTYKLTRFACLMVAMHADTRKPEVAKAKALLAAIADRLIQDRINDHDLGRIETRRDLAEAEKHMSGAAQAAGLESSKFAIFKNHGFRGMYNLSLRDLQERKRAPAGNVVLYDYMGLEELAGNLFRVTQTAARIKNSGVLGEAALNATAFEVGAEVRRIMIKNSGKTPESLPLEEDITRVKRRLKAAKKEMKKLDNKKPNKPGKGNTPPV